MKPPPPPFQPDFDKSNAVLIKKVIRETPILEAIRPALNTSDRLAVVSIERPATTDLPVNYLIEDNLIATLRTQGYKLAERDVDMIGRLLAEAGEQYAVVDVARLHQSQGEAGAGVPITSERALTVATPLAKADKLLSYRVLELGVLYKYPLKTEITPETDVTRLARIRLHLRVTDTQTGEIKLARLLDHEISDTIPAGQIRTLSNLHYTFFDQALPNVHPQTEKQSTIIQVQEEKAPSSGIGKSSLSIIVGGAVLGVLALLVSGQ